MKKIFSILLLALTLSLFTGCIFVGDVDYEPTPATYTLTFINNLPDSPNNDIFDWYLKDSNNNTHAVSTTHATVSSDGGLSKKRDLRSGRYTIYFTFDDTTDNITQDTFYITDSFYLKSDMEYTLSTISGLRTFKN